MWAVGSARRMRFSWGGSCRSMARWMPWTPESFSRRGGGWAAAKAAGDEPAASFERARIVWGKEGEALG
jgi:hypothetical protein